MWANYANENSGFCIEFLVNNPKLFFKINYLCEREKINLKELTNEEIIDKIIYSTLNKYKDWSFEEEYRPIAHFSIKSKEEITKDIFKNDREKKRIYIGYEDIKLNVKRIYIGLNCNETYKNRIIKLSREKGYSVFIQKNLKLAIISNMKR